MNKEWSEMNKRMQKQLNKTTFTEGINTLLQLRGLLMEEIISWKYELEEKDYYAIPFINADGYHSKTIAYSLWHIFRIEDIVVHTLIKNDRQVFFEVNYQKRMNSPIITTGNELLKEQISEFSKCLSLDVLYEYIIAVKTSTDEWLKLIDYTELKRKFGDEDKRRIHELNVVSSDEKAIWLIDYWCNKDVKGLIQMPLSRHWIMHVEAAIRIKNKIKRK
ncbi:phage head-tail adapter protein [Acetivibrio mesophilus]|uniref:Phage head-tail adapter protein n=1 Tax=Acetivibrio mesophilus TaxID=2487273 RepID=A0A4Q0I978_9FIRM|nr:phage head-tail adapter protein [Acetivibrio mesophilus]ODM26343.1 phage head-tail adapter protein [Clostridium sp. Bc-iso-3]RXE60597.1 phage head-tail adapter protein [Acetivibrio mesophilus]HHV30403.1 phage head-tail adapter protein [Clostridium sp.]